MDFHEIIENGNIPDPNYLAYAKQASVTSSRMNKNLMSAREEGLAVRDLSNESVTSEMTLEHNGW